jgi:hypothetical protein
MSKPTLQNPDGIPEKLRVLYEQYCALLNFGMTAAAGSLLFLLQAVILNKEFRELAATHRHLLRPQLLIAAMLLIGSALVLFAIAKYFNYIIFERQYLGEKDQIKRYFANELANELPPPSTITFKPYLGVLNKMMFFKVLIAQTEMSKYFAMWFLISGWIATLLYVWPLLPR